MRLYRSRIEAPSILPQGEGSLIAAARPNGGYGSLADFEKADLR
jgi:hypothetical protein